MEEEKKEVKEISTEEEVIGLLKKGPINSHQYTPTEWHKIALVLPKLKSKGVVESVKEVVQGGKGSLKTTVWKLKEQVS
jgi:hypothetical protein